jgi:hypothetical protein
MGDAGEGSPRVNTMKLKGESISCENLTMKSKMTKKEFQAHMILLFLIVVVFVAAMPKTTMAKSLYVIADKGSLSDATQPLNIYDIGSDGTLSLQAEHDIPHTVLGAVGMAIDSDNGFLFITYHGSEEIQLLDARTMTSVGTVIVPDAENLAGIVYDHDKMRVYCVDRGQEQLYVYDWDPATVTPWTNSSICFTWRTEPDISPSMRRPIGNGSEE